MASVTSAISTWTLTTSAIADAASTTPAQGSLDSAGAGITGGWSCFSFSFFAIWVYGGFSYSTCLPPTFLLVQSTYPCPTITLLTLRPGYTGSSLPLQIIIAFLLGLSLYNAIELIVLALVTFQRYQGLYFWSLLVSAGGIIPYSLGFIVKFFRLLDPGQNEGYVAVVLLTIGWWGMVSGKLTHSCSFFFLLVDAKQVKEDEMGENEG